jgi:hypothetical protein
MTWEMFEFHNIVACYLALGVIGVGLIGGITYAIYRLRGGY